MAEPVLDGRPQTNVFGEHEYKVRVSHGASTASTWRAMGVTVTRPTSTTLTLTFQKPYTEITTFSVNWAKATGADPVSYQITTNNIATTGVVTLTSVSTNSAGVATAPASGDVAYIEIGVSCDVLNDRYTGTTA